MPRDFDWGPICCVSEPVGADIESLCAKCGDVWHVVVAKVGETIAKVQCKQCGGLHRHKPPGGTTKPARAASSTAGATTRSGTRKAPAPAPPPPPGPMVAVDETRPPRPYRTTDAFTPGERVSHPTFGLGVVETAGAGKMQVFFPGGRRVLAQAKAPLALERPPARGPEDPT